MLVLYVQYPFFTDVALGAENVAEDHKHSLILANSAEDVRTGSRPILTCSSSSGSRAS